MLVSNSTDRSRADRLVLRPHQRCALLKPSPSAISSSSIRRSWGLDGCRPICATNSGRRWVSWPASRSHVSGCFSEGRGRRTWVFQDDRSRLDFARLSHDPKPSRPDSPGPSLSSQPEKIGSNIFRTLVKKRSYDPSQGEPYEREGPCHRGSRFRRF